MKVIDIRNFSVVKVGQACVLPEPTDVQCLIKIMQKNEKYVYWLQPKNRDFSCQIPVVNINGNYIQPSVKLEKAIFRHIRLTRNFQNFELLEDGRKKLRIPLRLLQEKQRTSNKFSVSSQNFISYIVSNEIYILTMPFFSQMMYKKNKTTFNRKKKDDILDDCIMQALQFMQEDAQIVCLVQSPSSRIQELADIFHAEFPHLECTMTLSSTAAASAAATTPGNP